MALLFVHDCDAETVFAPRPTADAPLLITMPPVPPRVIVPPLMVVPKAPDLPMINLPAPEKVRLPVSVVRPSPAPSSVRVVAPAAVAPLTVKVVALLFVHDCDAETVFAPRPTAEAPLLITMPPVPPRVIVPPLMVVPSVPDLPMTKPPAPEKLRPPVSVVRPLPVPSSVRVLAPPVTALTTVKVVAELLAHD